ncbi:TfoX/Sxy family protein [Xanthobacter agilis]|jgi:DNA transformation protein|uniref:DNA transformation protein n=1 Tax=Xanthobacter agilis TaxID=47492 RepID=A0ABU0LBZ4_XANAG|nr:TfoX/Sxy family protein [Xanthobacter agilis]MDQ0504628.1 DNA transformation protein [Xanthobacter agilis]
MEPETIADLFSAFGPVRLRRMFGGAGLYADGLMFALEADGVLYLKADAALAGDLAGRGSAPFRYVAKTGPRTMASFWQVPDAALDDGEELAALARRALAAARAAAREKDGKAAKALKGGHARRRPGPPPA